MNPVLAVLKKELKEALRDRRTLIMSIILPAVLVPALILGIFYFMDTTERNATKTGFTVAYSGSAQLEAFLVQAGVKVEKPVSVQDAVLSKKADVGLIEKVEGGTEVVTILKSYASGAKGDSAAAQLRALLEVYKQYRIGEYLRSKGLEEDVFSMVKVETASVGDPVSFVKYMIAYILSLMLLAIGFVGNVYLGTDVGAGEKERGTLEPLLATPANRLTLAVGKWLALSTLKFAATLITVTSFALTYTYALTHFSMGGPPLGHSVSVFEVWGSGIWAMVIGALLLAVSGAALQFMISMYSRNMREAQLYLGQLGMVVLPFVFIIMPSLTNATAIPNWGYYIPIINASVVVYNVITGNVVSSLVWVALAMDVVVALLLAVLVSKFMDRESVILRS